MKKFEELDKELDDYLDGKVEIGTKKVDV